MNRRQRRRIKHAKALLMIHVGRFEIQRLAPPNFYNWSHKAKQVYLAKRWPRWKWCGNGRPFSCGGRDLIPDKSISKNF